MTNSSSRTFLRLDKTLSVLPVWLERFFLAVLFWQLAGLFWLVFAPSTGDINLVMPSQSPVRSLAMSEAFLRWYGVGDKVEVNKAGDYKLLAVIAGKRGAAVLKSGDSPSVAVRVGEEISPGSKLIAVEPTGITYEQSGVRKQLALPQSNAEPLFAKSEQKPQAKRPLTPIKITQGQLASVVQGSNLGTWDKGLSSAPEGGIRVENAATQAISKVLQLKNGDILKSINQRPLVQLADISLLFHFFGQSAPVDLVLVRNGATFIQHYDIQP